MERNNKAWKLKPCPFCGAEAEWRDWTSERQIACTNCPARMRGTSTWILHRKWNKRKHETPQSRLPTPKENWFENIKKETQK